MQTGAELVKFIPRAKRAESDWRATVTLGCPRCPKWDLLVVLRALMGFPFPIALRRSELHALAFDKTARGWAGHPRFHPRFPGENPDGKQLQPSGYDPLPVSVGHS
jgi:hypothetical protein